MPRPNITPQARALINSKDNPNACIALVTISHPSLPAVLRLSSDNVNTTSNGLLYTAFPLEVKMLDEVQNEITSSVLRLFWVDASIKDLVQEVNDEAGTCGVQWVFENYWDDVQWSIDPPLMIKKASIKEGVANFDLGLRSLESEEVPVHDKNPFTHPGLWANR